MIYNFSSMGRRAETAIATRFTYERSIELRTQHIEQRAQAGRWEADTIASALFTIMESKSENTCIALLPEPTASSSYQAIVQLLEPMAHMVKTITTDTGGGAWYEKLDVQLCWMSCFCRSYASGQRGTNEIINGLLHQCPSSTIFILWMSMRCKSLWVRLNHRSLTRLQFRTSHQGFVQSLKKTANRSCIHANIYHPNSY